jgi:hydrogenase maturation factor
MTLQELQNQALHLSIGDRWRLVQSLLSSIEQETLVLNPPTTNVNSLAGLDPWTQSLIGVVQLGVEEPTESYVDYLEEKYS